MSNLIGTNPDQVPVNGMLGDMAFQDSDNVKVGSLVIGTTTGSIKFPDNTVQTTAATYATMLKFQ